jgi:hypothetical protein
MLIDATTTKPGARLYFKVEAAIGRYIRTGPDHSRMDTMSVVIADERPSNAVERREAALSVFLYKHLYTDFDYDKMVEEINAMVKLGRTERWHNALANMQRAVLHNMDTNYAITQYTIFANYAAR